MKPNKSEIQIDKFLDFSFKIKELKAKGNPFLIGYYLGVMASEDILFFHSDYKKEIKCLTKIVKESDSVTISQKLT